MSTDYRYPLTWRHKFKDVSLNENGIGSPTIDIYYRILQMEGTSDNELREITITYLIYRSHLNALLNYLTPPIRSASQSSCVPVHANHELSLPDGTSTEQPIPYPQGYPRPLKVRARSVTWKAHLPDKPIDPFSVDSSDININNSNVDETLTAPTYGDVVEVTVVYDNKQKSIKADDPWTWLDIRASASGEFLSIKGHSGTWGTSGGDSILDGMPDIKVIWPTTEWSVTWAHIPKECFERNLKPRLDKALGDVNRYTFDVLFEAPPETIMFVGYEIEEEGESTYGGFQTHPLTLEMKFLEKKKLDLNNPSTGDQWIGHNHFWNDEVGRWEYLYVDGFRVYDRYDFNVFFAFDAGEEEPLHA